MDWKGKGVLVTGAGGFIGSHLVERLIELGAEVKCFIRYTSKGEVRFLESIRDEIEIIAGDLRDSDAVEKAVRGMKVVFHLGALVGIPYSYLHPREVVETNTIGTLNVLLACRNHGVEKMVHTSTSEVYGTARYVPIDENHPLQGQSPYSASKIGADKIAESFYDSYDLPLAIARPFNAYGPRQSARAVIPTIITQALTSGEVKLGNTSPTRDLTYVDDTVEGFVKIATSAAAVGEVINIGSGQEISVGDLANKIAGLTGKNVQMVKDERRLRPEKSEVERLWADNRKAKELIGWESKVSLEEGLKRTINWVKNSLDMYQPERYSI